MDSEEKRIERAWKESKDWVAEFSGSPAKTYLMNVPAKSLPEALQRLAQQSENFRVSVISGQHQDEARFVGLETVPENLNLLMKDEIAELSFGFSAPLAGFVLDIRMIVYPLDSENYALELVWWRDQAFPDDADPQERFRILASYFIQLQVLFHAPNLFIGPETEEMPSKESRAWVEI